MPAPPITLHAGAPTPSRLAHCTCTCGPLPPPQAAVEAAQHDRAAQAVQATRLREEVDVLRKQVGGRALGGVAGAGAQRAAEGEAGWAPCLAPSAFAARTAAARAAVRWPHV